jgi:SAM-dependent methyltransferase
MGWPPTRSTTLRPERSQVEEQFAGRYEDFERWHWWFRGRQRILESVLERELARERAAGIVPRLLLTVGCGPAPGIAWLAALLGDAGRVIGLDADPSGALRARREPSQALPSGVAFAYGRAEATPLRSGSCDAALALDVLEHMEDDAPALAEAARVVRPGGFVLVTVPAFPSLWGSQDVVSHHKRRYTAATLARTFERAGVLLSWHSYFNTALFPPVAAVRWGRRLLGAGAGAARSDFDAGRPGLVNEALVRLFAAERHLLGRVRLPFGVSLAAVARLPRGA